ncbi:MAG: SdpI family protein [Halobacteriaceae archaeon]
MRLERRTVAGGVLVLAAVAASVLVAPSLPDQLTTHWNAAGQPDGTTGRTAVLVGGPALVLLVVGSFELVPRVDPLAENFADFQAAYDAVAVLTAAFAAYAYGFVLAWNLGYEVAVARALVPAVAVLYVAVGFLMDRAERNWFVGVRTPWTLSSPAVWRETHDLAATLFKLAGAVALGGLLAPELLVYFLAGPVAVAALVATVYSYVAYRRLGDGDPADATP